MKLKYIPFVFLTACGTNTDTDEIAKLPLKEVSGIEYADGKLWVLEDSGNKDKIYRIAKDGKIQQEIKLTNVKNNDWEDIASDNEGNIYIGDFGNNDNDRKNLAIYKVDKTALSGTSAEASAITIFHYPEQTEFPPKKSERFFDAEAFYERAGYFYIFTKNRSSGFNGNLTVYRVPNRAGDFAAENIGMLNTCGVYKKCAVTAADISPDGTTAVLLAGDRYWLVTGFTANDFSKAVMQEYRLSHHTQKEGICFADDTTLLITDEKDKRGGGKLYSVTVPGLKNKP